MAINIDEYGRVLIPKEIRDQLGLSAGMELEVDVKEQELRLSPSHPEPELKERNDLLVFSGEAAEELSAPVKHHREERMNKFTGT